ncbi:MAG: SPOR domain-containing protein [Microbacteriaceae bacterium]|nr:SPOR domain-containing protein [Microbacteriaceae bacterium]
MSGEGAESYWYNMKTGEVEFGFESPSIDRVGPFDTREAAEHALDTLRANSDKWTADEQNNA